MSGAGAGAVEGRAAALERQAEDGRSLLTALGWVAAFGVLACALSVSSGTTASAPPFVGRLGFCLILGGAAFFVGGLVGFVFGVPKRVQAAKPGAGASGAREGYAGNSNLERVSDWLTKVLIGAGLTQLGQIPGALRGAGTFVEGALGPGTGALAVLLFLYWGIAGFFFSYVFARRILPSWWFRGDQEGLRAQYRQAVREVATRNIKFQRDGGDGKDRSEQIVFNALYLPAPGGFEKAIEVGEAVEREKRTASLEAYLASAYGQKYAWEQDLGGTPESLSRSRSEAFSHAQRAIELDATWRDVLRAFLDPRPGALDDDLAAFRNDPEFRKLVGA
jgi:hypothetical protein